MPKVREHFCSLEPFVSQSGWTSPVALRAPRRTDSKGKGVQGSPFCDLPQRRLGWAPGLPDRLAAARERHAVLFKPSTFFAISPLAGWGSPPRPLLMSAPPALAPPAPTSRAPGAAAPRGLRLRRGGCKLAGTHGGRSGEGTRAEGASSLPPASGSAGRGWRNPGPPLG